MAYDANMFAEWYGEGTGIMYLDGVYGNLMPDVPKVQIEKPTISHTYLFGLRLPILIKKLPIQKAAPRIIGNLIVNVATENSNRVEFYVDDVKQYIDDEAPFTWDLQATRGLHTLEVRAYNDNNMSIDLVDFYIFI